MLVLWTQDSAQILKNTVADLVKVVPHRVCGVTKQMHSLKQLPDIASDDLLFALGNDAKEILAANKVVQKGRAIGSLRSRLHPLPNGAQCMVSYSPSIRHTDYSLYIEMVCDLQLSMRWVQTGSLVPKVGKYEWVEDFSSLKKYVEDRYKATGKPVRVTCDTETVGTDPRAPEAYIVTVQLTAQEATGSAVRFNSREDCLLVRSSGPHSNAVALWWQLHWFLTSPMVSLRGANWKFDQGWLTYFWELPQSTNFKFDTTIVGSLLDENRSNSLNTHAKVATTMGGYDDAFNQKYDKSRMDLALADDPDGFLVYACGDTDACYRVADKFQKEITKDGNLSNFYVKILHPAVRAYEVVENVGWYVDRSYYEFFREEVEDEIARLTKAACEILGGRIVIKHTDPDDGTINITKASLLKDFMFSPMGLNLKPKMMTAGGKDGKGPKHPSTSIDHLMMFSDDPKAKDFIKLIEEYGSAAKVKNTYINGFLKHLRSDGRFHPNFFLYAGANDFGDDEGGTVTGRTSCKEPAIQTIPKRGKWAKKLRRCFIAPPGYLILGCDFSQGELRIMACLGNALKMIEAYKGGIDLHSLTSSRLKGIPWDVFMKMKEDDPDGFEAIRYLGKASNFGLIYGQQAQGFQTYAKLNYGLDITLDDSQGYIDKFFGLYPELLAYQESQKNFAKDHGYVVSPLGRVRHLPLIKSPDKYSASKEGRRAVNSPTQSVLSDMSLWAAAKLWQMGSFDVAPMFGMIHDQNLRYVPEDSWEKYTTQMVEVMENLPFKEMGWEPQLNFPVDPELGPNLGTMSKLERTPTGFKMKGK